MKKVSLKESLEDLKYFGSTDQGNPQFLDSLHYAKVWGFNLGMKEVLDYLRVYLI